MTNRNFAPACQGGYTAHRLYFEKFQLSQQ